MNTNKKILKELKSTLLHKIKPYLEEGFKVSQTTMTLIWALLETKLNNLNRKQNGRWKDNLKVTPAI